MYSQLRDTTLACGRLENFSQNSVKTYPVFRRIDDPLAIGTSLCRLGFPFSKITATFDEENKTFRIADGVLPMPRFPNEGIHTRLLKKSDQESNRVATFVETSTPGLKGQSGGPILDVSGRICALQSGTVHLPLGFTPKVKTGNTEVVEHQFMHVGFGAHVTEILKFLDNHGIAYQTE